MLDIPWYFAFFVEIQIGERIRRLYLIMQMEQIQFRALLLATEISLQRRTGLAYRGRAAALSYVKILLPLNLQVPLQSIA